MVNFFHPCASLKLPQEDYAEDAATDSIEKSIAESLPVLVGLSSDLTASQRMGVYESNVAAAFVHFTLLYGEPFGCCEHVQAVIRRSSPVEPKISMPNFGFALPSFS